MLNNNLQLYRNDVYFNDKETAKSALESQLKASSDGELVISRYAVKDENDIVVDVKTLFGFSANGSNGVFATICDYEDFFTNSKLKDLKFNDVDAIWDTNTSVSFLVNASDINTPRGYITIPYGAIGDTTFKSIGANEPIDSALSKIESNIDTLIQVIVDNELVTANALTKLNDSIDSVESELQSQSDRITQLGQKTSVVDIGIIKTEKVEDENGNIIEKFTLAEEINITCDEY